MEYFVLYLLLALLLIAVFFSIRDMLAPKEEVRDWLTKEEAEAFTGENGAYYLDKWKDRTDSILKGWNWSAAFFAVEWMAYRKMYLRSLVMLPGFWIGFGPRKMPIAILFYAGLSRFLDNWIALVVSVYIARFIGGGLFGNILYREDALSALKKSLPMSEPARLAYLQSKGGTNAIAPVIAILIQAIGIIAAIFILG